MSNPTFIIDCCWCKAKVAAMELGQGTNIGYDPESGDPFGHRLYIGKCPTCGNLLAGESDQTHFPCYNAEYEKWTEIVRVHPMPPKRFRSYRIPKQLSDSLSEAELSLQANANTAACVMLGRALEALCRDILNTHDSKISQSSSVTSKKIMLGEGIKRLRDLNFIDARLFDWSQELHAFRNIAAHPDDFHIERQDAEDLQTFAYAIIEYVYDLAERYNEFKARIVRPTPPPH
jgi:hypothetical protein